MANIKDEKAHDPFPKSGLVKQYEPKIRKEVREYAKQYPRLRYEELLAEAVKIAVNCEKRFNPELGNSFWTLLVHHLKNLHRFGQKEFSSWQMPVPKAQRDANDLERRRNGSGGDDPRAVIFAGGGNGARITVDVQWLTGPEIRHRTSVRSCEVATGIMAMGWWTELPPT